MFLLRIPAFLLFLVFIFSLAYLSWQANLDQPEKERLFRIESKERQLALRKNKTSFHIFWDAALAPALLKIDQDARFTQARTVDVPAGSRNCIEVHHIPLLPRPYFQLEQPGQKNIILAERSLPFEKVNNFRDLGGYQTDYGQMLKWGLVYRSGHLSSASKFDLALLQDLHIETVIDLRSTDEYEKYPDLLLPEMNYLQIPFFRADPFQFKHIMFQRHKLGHRLQNIYTRWVIDGSAHEIGKVFQILSIPDNLPVLIHCTAGKDRTGIIAALLLLALDIPESTAIADYTLSNRFADRFMGDYRHSLSYVRFLGIKQEHFYPIIATPPEMMRTTIDYIKTNYGSVEQYLLKTAGVSEETLVRLKSNLLEC